MPDVELLVRLIVASLATWRVSSLLTSEDGPWHVFARIRTRAGLDAAEPKGFWCELLGCLWCVSVWVGAGCAVLSLLPGPWWLVLWPLALSACAILAARYMGTA